MNAPSLLLPGCPAQLLFTSDKQADSQTYCCCFQNLVSEKQTFLDDKQLREPSGYCCNVLIDYIRSQGAEVGKCRHWSALAFPEL